MIKKSLAIAAIIGAMLALLAGSASAQDPGYPPDDEVFNASIDNTTPAAGETVTISGQCNVADTVVIAIVGVGDIGSIPVNDDDSFSGPITIPSNLDPGTYTLTATCGDAEVLSIDITVTAGGGSGGSGNMGGGSGTGPLARTGSEVDGLVKIGGGLLLAGAAATLIATKRRSATA